jgi:hypothetical protein
METKVVSGFQNPMNVLNYLIQFKLMYECSELFAKIDDANEYAPCSQCENRAINVPSSA